MLMERALIFLSTVGCAALGWFLASHHRSSPFPVLENNESAAAPVSAITTPRESRVRTVDVHKVLARIKADFPAEHQDDERIARLFDEFEDLKDDEFASTILDLSSQTWPYMDLARLLVGYWAERDLPAARQWVLSLDEKALSRFGDAVFDTWSYSDLPGMFDWLESHADEMPSNWHRQSAG